MQIGSLDDNMDDLRDQVTSTEGGGWSFMCRFADALELHRPEKGKNEYLSVNKIIQRSDKSSR